MSTENSPSEVKYRTKPNFLVSISMISITLRLASLYSVEEFCTAMSCCCNKSISSIVQIINRTPRAKLFRVAHELGSFVELGTVASLVQTEIDVSLEVEFEAVSVTDS